MGRLVAILSFPETMEFMREAIIEKLGKHLSAPPSGEAMSSTRSSMFES